MDVLFIGLSSIVQRRLLPALATLASIERIDIASCSRPVPQDWPKRGRFFQDYGAAIAESDAELVYVSLPNSLHLEWILASLSSGRHVVADKPATLTLAQARQCVDEAAARGMLLAEATVFSSHTQFTAMRELMAEIGPLTHVNAHFIIPPMPTGNFRNHRTLGGGCLQDMGPYAAAVARLFGGGTLAELAAFDAPPAADRDIDMGFSFVARFESGVRYTGHFSFESEYQNRLTLIGKRGSIDTERVFSAPPDLSPVWHVRRGSKSADEKQAPSDSFREFLAAAVEAVVAKDYHAFHQNLLSDAAFRDRLATALGYGDHHA